MQAENYHQNLPNGSQISELRVEICATSVSNTQTKHVLQNGKLSNSNMSNMSWALRVETDASEIDFPHMNVLVAKSGSKSILALGRILKQISNSSQLGPHLAYHLIFGMEFCGGALGVGGGLHYASDYGLALLFA